MEKENHPNAPQVGDRYYFRKGVATIREYNDPVFGPEFEAQVLVAPRTTAEVKSVTDRNIRIHSEGKRLKGGVYGRLESEANLPITDVLSGAARIVPHAELFDKSTPRYQAWRAVHTRYNNSIPVEIVVGPVIPGESLTQLPREATIVTLPQSMHTTAAD